MSISPARESAFSVLRAVRQGRGEPASLLHADKLSALSAADRRLATELVYGVLRFQSQLNFVLAHHSRRPLSKIDPDILTILQLALYQMRVLDRVPVRAAIDEAVRMTKAIRQPQAHGFVNGLLRNVARTPEQPQLPSHEEAPLAFLTTTLSYPEWLAKRSLARLGLEAAASRFERQNRPPVSYLRLSSSMDLGEAVRELAEEGIEAEIFPLVPCLKLIGGDIHSSKLYRQGQLFIQDAGSQLIAKLMGGTKTDRILDACAAPGGKATAIASMIAGASVWAIDKRPKRAALLRQLCDKLHQPSILVVAADAKHLPFGQLFDRILLDVPCSSLGTIRRNPDLKWRLSESSLVRHHQNQVELLRSVGGQLVPGGRVLYATCSTEPEENEDVVREFLGTHSGFELESLSGELSGAARHLIDADGFFRSYPERDDFDGYFAARLRRIY